MKKWISIICILCISLVLIGCEKKEVANTTENTSTFAMWFSYLDYEELAQNLDEQSFRTFVIDAITNMTDIGVNTVYVHAVAFTDALYDSEIYPRSKSLPDITYDPLKIWVEEGHKKNIRIEAWINPLRSVAEDCKEDAPTQIQDWIQKNDERVRLVNGRYYLNPAYEDVRNYIASIVLELITNYKVDGIHLDDYFYPEGIANKFDAYIYEKTGEIENISREDFRRNAINDLVETLYLTVKKKNQDIQFGISVAGNNDNNKNLYYADISAWIEKGTIDYLIPQIYWGFNHPTKPYTETLMEFQELITNPNVKLYSGLAAYKIGQEDIWAKDANMEWVDNTNIIARQIEVAFEKGCQGIAYFRYASLFPKEDISQGNVEKEIINIKSFMKSFQSPQ